VSLLERIRRQQCAVVDCQRQREPDAAVCREDLNELWANRLTKRPDGQYERRRTFIARDMTAVAA
jgi:hypothetical protein